jgi:hypothetical protein
MDERRANIDLAFRNGLKDFEVLPPPEVWGIINHKLKRKEGPLYIMRAAAFLAIAMTISVLATRWIGKTSSLTYDSVMALNEESSSPYTGNETEIPLSVNRQINRTQEFPVNSLVENSPDLSPLPVNDNTVPVLISIQGTKTMFAFRTPALNIVGNQAELNGPRNNTLALNNIDKVYQDYIVDNNSMKGQSRWSIAALASPTYYGKISSGNDAISKQITSSEKAIVSYSGGLALSYKVNKRLSIQSGLFYSSVGQELNGINSFAGFQKYVYTKGDHNFEVLTTNGTVYTNNADVFLMANGNTDRIITNYNNDVFDPNKASLEYINNTMRQTFSYLELPVILRYKVIDKTIDFNLIGGLSYNMLVNNSVYTVVDGNKYEIGTTEGLNMFSISSSVGMGMEYKFSDKLSLNLEPTFRYYLNTFNNSTGSRFHPYSFGIFSGVSYKF